MDKPQILPKQLTLPACAMHAGRKGNCKIHSTIALKVLIVLPDLPLYLKSGKENNIRLYPLLSVAK